MASPRSSGKPARDNAEPASPPRSPAPAQSDPLPVTEPSPADSARLAAAVANIAAVLTRPMEGSRVFRTVAEQAAAVLRTDSATVCMLNPEEGTLRMGIGTGVLAPREGELLPLEASLVGLAVITGVPQHSANIVEDPRAYRPADRGVHAGPALAVPLRVGGRTTGSLLAIRQAPAAPFDQADISIALAVAEVAAAAIENVRLFGEARQDRAILQARRREAELLDWLARYDTLAEADRKIVFEWDLATDAFNWGGSLDAVLGYGSAELGSAAPAWATKLHPEDRERVLTGMRDAAEAGEPFRLEARLQDAHREYRRVLVRGGSPVNVPGGQRVIGAIDDMTDRDRGTAERERLARFGAVREIIRGLRHEINNPLAVVMGQAQLLQKEPAVNSDPLLRQSITAIFEEGSRMEELLRRLAEIENDPREPILNDLGGLNLPPQQR